MPSPLGGIRWRSRARGDRPSRRGHGVKRDGEDRPQTADKLACPIEIDGARHGAAAVWAASVLDQQGTPSTLDAIEGKIVPSSTAFESFVR